MHSQEDRETGPTGRRTARCVVVTELQSFRPRETTGWAKSWTAKALFLLVTELGWKDLPAVASEMHYTQITPQAFHLRTPKPATRRTRLFVTGQPTGKQEHR